MVPPVPVVQTRTSRPAPKSAQISSAVTLWASGLAGLKCCPTKNSRYLTHEYSAKVTHRSSGSNSRQFRRRLKSKKIRNGDFLTCAFLWRESAKHEMGSSFASHERTSYKITVPKRESSSEHITGWVALCEHFLRTSLAFKTPDWNVKTVRLLLFWTRTGLAQTGHASASATNSIQGKDSPVSAVARAISAADQPARCACRRSRFSSSRRPLFCRCCRVHNGQRQYEPQPG